MPYSSKLDLIHGQSPWFTFHWWFSLNPHHGCITFHHLERERERERERGREWSSMSREGGLEDMVFLCNIGPARTWKRAAKSLYRWGDTWLGLAVAPPKVTSQRRTIKIRPRGKLGIVDLTRVKWSYLRLFSRNLLVPMCTCSIRG
jgi:hypothetical protein